MEPVVLNINLMTVPHTVIPIIGDGACLFRSISYHVYGTQMLFQEVREDIVSYVVNNWNEFSYLTHDLDGNNYSNPTHYSNDMLRTSTFGSSCELKAAAELYSINFEVYIEGNICASLGTQGNIIKRLIFTGPLSGGHYEALEPCESFSKESRSKSSRKRRARFTTDIRRKKNKEAAIKYTNTNSEVHNAASAKYKKTNPENNRLHAKKYQQNKPEVHRAAVERYQHNFPEAHRASVASYQKNNPEIHRAAVATYQGKNLHVHRSSQTTYRENRAQAWKVKAKSGMKYNLNISYENDSSMDIGNMIHKCRYCHALKWKDESAGICCSSGKAQLSPFEPLPELLQSLLTMNHPETSHFMKYIRKYNSCFQMTSFGATHVVKDGFMPTFKVHGQVYHLMGSLIPQPQQNPNFLQIYFMGNDERETSRRCAHFPEIKPGLVKQLQTMLHEVNNFVKDLKTTLDRIPSSCETFEVVIHADKKPTSCHAGRFNVPTTNEVALVIVGQQFEKRDIIIQSHGNKLQRISELHRSYDALQYPLIFCHGEDGYAINIPLRDPITKNPLGGKTVSAAQFYAYRIMMRDGELNHVFRYRSLFSQFLVDMYAKIETERLNYIRNHQKELRSDSYINLRDAVGRQDCNANELGKIVILPSSFTGGPRYMHERTQDAMTYVRNYGRPDLFITFTCNPKWKEITDALFPLQKPSDRHDIIARVFHLKVKKLMGLLTKGHLFGKVRCFMYSVEWQKRGLPHVHILLWLEQRISSEMIDSVICAEIPDPANDHLLYEIVKSNMIHGPCGNINANSPCMNNGKCSKRYPRAFIKDTQTGEDGYPKYKRRSPDDGGFSFTMKDKVIDNRWVVPYNAVLLRTFNAHINVEICNSVKSIKYICKYVNKGSDQAAFALENEKDEIKIYESGRYISSSEAVWRILAFSIHERYPPVFHLAVHLENGQRVYFSSDNVIEKVTNPPQTTLLAYFELCKIDDFAKTLFYFEVPSYYVWKCNKFEKRKRGNSVDDWPNMKKDHVIGRVYTIHPNNSECYYLRMLLHVIKGPTSFSDLKTVNGNLYPTFQNACLALGLLENDKHWDSTLEEAAVSDNPRKLRDLFAVMLVFCHISDASTLWEKHRKSLSEDIIMQLEKELGDISENILAEAYNRCIIQIDDIVQAMGGNHLQYYGMPQPNRLENILLNREYLLETSYDTSVLNEAVYNNEKLLTDEQGKVYGNVLNSIESGGGQVFFLDAPGGTGKTFLINLLLIKVRSNGHIALAVASSGIAATLLEGGRTAHATFKLPLNLIHVENPMCNIPKQSNMAKVLRDCKLIVWDESTMAHKGGFEALNSTLQDIRSSSKVMGGLTVLLAGDFRQTLPIVPRGTRADEVKACLKSSYLWRLTTKLSLHKNMRVHLKGDDSAEKFSEILLEIGDKKFPEKCGKVHIPHELGTVVKSLPDLISNIYPDISNINDKSNDWLCERAILTPKNDKAAVINHMLLKSFEGAEMEYISIDTVLQTEDAVHYPVEFLNSLNPPGFPPHRLILKNGTPIMLLRNLKPPKLCNGTRLRVKALQKNVIEATILTGCSRGETVFIPRIPLIPSEFPFEFKRLQFPIKISFAITINKSQGQSLKMAGIDLSEECFSHGQFYVACSRVSTPRNLYILAPEGKTGNVVYQEVLR